MMTTKKLFKNDILLISLLFLGLGVGGLFWLYWSTIHSPDVDEALKNMGNQIGVYLGMTNYEAVGFNMGQIIYDKNLFLAFLDSMGIIIPFVVLVMGLRFIQMSYQIAKQRIETVRWGQVAVLWLTVGAVLLTLLQLFTRSQADPTAGIPFSWERGISAAIPWLALAIACGAGVVWYTRQRDIIMRDETLIKRNVRMAWNLLMPTLAVLIVVAARPLEQTFVTSLTDKRFAGTEDAEYIGLDNYSQLLTMRLDTVECRKNDAGECTTSRNGNTSWALIPREYLLNGYTPVITIPFSGNQALVISSTDSTFIESVLNTIHFTILSVSLELVLGLFIAMVVNSKFKGRGFIRAVMLVPWAIPTVISARLWELMLRDNQSGIINKILLDLGLISQSQAWLSNSDLQINALIMVDVWKTTPFMALLLLAGLQLIPEDLYEAASIDGASRVQQFFTVTLPLLRPTIAIALIFRSLDALRAFDVFQVLLGRQKMSMATYNYETLIQSQQAGYGSAVSVIIFILISIFTIIYVRSIKMENV